MAVEAQIQEKSESHKEFEKLLDKDFENRKLKEGQIVTATVTEILKSFIVLDLFAKQEAMIPIEEFKEGNELENLKVGSVVECFLERIESNKGEIIVSYSKAKRLKIWKELENIAKTGEPLTAELTSRVKGGFVATYKGVLPCFVPSSQLDLRPLKRVDHLFGIPLQFVVVRIDTVRGNAALSRRKILEQNKNAETQELLKEIKVGDQVLAECKGVTEFGAFFSYKNLDMLCHITDMSHGRVKSPKDLISPNDKIKVVITKIDTETSRISCSIKGMVEDPYENLKFEVGKVYKGTVQKIVQYGAFIRLADGVEGLCHQSFMSHLDRNVEPNKVMSVSQEVSVKIVSIENETRRISLSYKDNGEFENPWDKIEINSIHETKITSITEKAIFSTLSSGIVGMTSYKELNYTESPEELKKYKKGQTLKVCIIDNKDQKLRFSVRALEKDPFEYFTDKKLKVGSIISTKVIEVTKSGVKVAIDPDKKIITIIRKNQLAIEAIDCRPEIYSAGNVMADAKIIELDVSKRRISISPKECAKDEAASLVAKFGKGAAKSGRSLAGIFSAALGATKNKKKKD
jgi:small subunit ribosomal protein S1|tara:strand:+ start:56 stop:1777 length:1722 start_codon:yes stop_codon:yes gene_type:complete